MNIKHEPVYVIETAIKTLSERDGVELTYVCTTDLRSSDQPWDVFFRETPHPKFGNRYVGLTNRDGQTYITNADIVEDFEFGMVESDGELHYSSTHHDYKSFPNGNMIDGGRQYVRGSGVIKIFKIKDGKFVEEEV